MKKIVTLMVMVAATALTVSAQKTIVEVPCKADQTIRHWNNAKAPHSNEQTKDEERNSAGHFYNTSETVFYLYKAAPETATGQSVVVLPGGGYGAVCIEKEGFKLAEYFQSLGVTALVVKYRLPNDGHKEVPLEDATGAIRYMRTRTDLGVNPAKVGILGNSAGGHLASWTSNAMSEEERPAFAILHYPAIDRTAPLYLNTKKTTGALLGKGYSNAEAEAISSHRMVTRTTPPTLLLLCDDDVSVPPTSPLDYYEALVQYGVKCSIHIFPKGGHSLSNNLGESRALMLDWLDQIGMTK